MGNITDVHRRNSKYIERKKTVLRLATVKNGIVVEWPKTTVRLIDFCAGDSK